MIGINNTSTTKTKGRSRFSPILLTPVLLGNYAMSTATTNGSYELVSNALALVPGHPFSGLTGGTTIGTATAYVYNITKKKVEKVTVPLSYLININDNVFFRIGSSQVGVTRWDSIGLTMPDSGDSMKLSVILQLDGARPVGGWKQTWTAS